MPEDTLLTLEQAASECPYPVVTLRQACQRGHLQGVKVSPRLWMVTLENLQAWVNDPVMHIRGAKAKVLPE